MSDRLFNAQDWRRDDVAAPIVVGEYQSRSM